MTRTKFVKILVDVLMYFDFIFLMSHGTVRNLSFHAYGGIALFVLFLIHHILNRWFYKTLTKGKYTSQRILISVTAWLLFVLMILMALSSIFASGAVFENSPFMFTQVWRTVHLLSTSWAYMIMSFHLGLHLHFVLKKLEYKTGDCKFRRILLYLFYILIIFAGCFALWESQLYVYLFNTGNWKMAAPNLFVSYIEYIGITAAVSLIYHLVKVISSGKN